MKLIKTLEEKAWVIGLAFLLILAATDSRGDTANEPEFDGKSVYGVTAVDVGLATF